MKHHIIFYVIISFIMLMIGKVELFAQQQDLYGIINTYAQVGRHDDCGQYVVLMDASGFSPGDRALLIQMKGCHYYDGDDRNFGQVEYYSSCGAFEFVTIDAVISGKVVFESPTVHYYQAGAAQLIKVPQYGDVRVTNGPNSPQSSDPLTAMAWNNSTNTGGVLVFEASGTVTLNADISVDGKGFVGGSKSADNIDSNLFSYIYDPSENKSGKKGEGAGIVPDSLNSGRGPSVNGGGGGNARNAGGGGGGNAGAGGDGGRQLSSVKKYRIGGLGGLAYEYTNPLSRIFLGGGGGGGHQNYDSDLGGSSAAGDGGTGGGIIIIRANKIVGNGHTISANGLAGGTAVMDGGGGGGAGGVVLLSVPLYEDDELVTPDLIIEAQGGDGGNAYANISPDCPGPGGGGGGGIVGLSFSASAYPSDVKIDAPPTYPGIDGGTKGSLGASCTDNAVISEDLANGAKDGGKGKKLYSIVLPGDPAP